MVLLSESPVNMASRRSSTTSIVRSSQSYRSGYILPEGQSPDESWFSKFITDFILCGCLYKWRGSSDTPFTAHEEEFLDELRIFFELPFDSTNSDHEKLLKSIWTNTFPGSPLPPPIDASWTRLGFQSQNPRTDLRTGVHALEAMEYMSRKYSVDFRRAVQESSVHGDEYPFAASCVSIAFSLVIFFKLNKRTSVNPSGSASGTRLAVKQFVRLSLTNSDCFNELFSEVVLRVHEEWMSQLPGHFDIHFFATALSRAMSAVADLFNKKRIHSIADFKQLRK